MIVFTIRFTEENAGRICVIEAWWSNLKIELLQVNILKLTTVFTTGASIDVMSKCMLDIRIVLSRIPCAAWMIWSLSS